MSAAKVQAGDAATVKQWLSKHPSRAITVAVSVKGADGERQELLSWLCNDTRPEQAAELVAAVDSYARATERDALASVVWSGKDGKVLQTRLLRRRCPEVESAEIVGPLNGSPMDQAAQAQRHLEKMTNLYYNGLGGMMLQMKDLAKTAIDMARDVMDRTARDRELIEDLREQIQEIVVTQAEVAAESAEEAAKKSEDEKQPSAVEMAVGMGMQMLMANATPSAPGVAAAPKVAD